MIQSLLINEDLQARMKYVRNNSNSQSYSPLRYELYLERATFMTLPLS